MVLTQTENFNILHDNQLIVIFMKDCPVNQIPDILLIPLREKHKRFRIPFGSFAETFAFGILADALKDCPDGSAELLEAFSRFGRCGLETGACTNTCERRQPLAEKATKQHGETSRESGSVQGQLSPSKSMGGLSV